METSTTNAPTVAPPNAPPNAPPQSFRQKLDAGERYWTWKIGLRGITVLLGIIGIGCAAWIVSTALSSRSSSYDIDDGWGALWSLITFSISVIWGSVCVLVFLLRKRPVHPGVAVGLDLVLWLAYIPTFMFAIIGVISVLSWGEDGIVGRYSSDGYYYHAPNGTWVWNATEYDSYYGRERACAGGSRRYSSYGFDSCEEQDAYINNIWATRPHRAGVEMTAVVCQGLGLLLHLALFIWACVDTHFRNSQKVSKEAEQLAADIVMRMVQSGALIRAPNPAHQHPPPFAQQLNAYSHAQPNPPGSGPRSGPAISATPPPQQMPLTMPPQAAMSYGEKGQSSRFA